MKKSILDVTLTDIAKEAKSFSLKKAVKATKKASKKAAKATVNTSLRDIGTACSDACDALISWAD